jgi:hypothetical protein
MTVRHRAQAQGETSPSVSTETVNTFIAKVMAIPNRYINFSLYDGMIVMENA